MLILSRSVIICFVIFLCTSSFSYAAESSIMIKSKKAASIIASILKNKLSPTSPILITSLVDESDYTKSSSLGKLISDQISLILAQKGFYVLDTKLGKELRLSKEGSAFMLTTKTNNLLSHNYDAEAVLVGTYLVGEKNILISFRVVALGNGKILAGHTYTLNLTKEVKLLLVEKTTQRDTNSVLKQYERKRVDSAFLTK